jgi:hypothetical protein
MLNDHISMTGQMKPAWMLIVSLFVFLAPGRGATARLGYNRYRNKALFTFEDHMTSLVRRNTFGNEYFPCFNLLQAESQLHARFQTLLQRSLDQVWRIHATHQSDTTCSNVNMDLFCILGSKRSRNCILDSSRYCNYASYMFDTYMGNRGKTQDICMLYSSLYCWLQAQSRLSATNPFLCSKITFRTRVMRDAFGC